MRSPAPYRVSRITGKHAQSDNVCSVKSPDRKYVYPEYADGARHPSGAADGAQSTPGPGFPQGTITRRQRDAAIRLENVRLRAVVAALKASLQELQQAWQSTAGTTDTTQGMTR